MIEAVKFFKRFAGGGAINPAMAQPAPEISPPPAASEPEPAPPTIWENLITLNSDAEPNIALLPPAREHYMTDSRKDEWQSLDFAAALERDIYPLPVTADREGYYGPDHFSYWASGLADARYLLQLADSHDLTVDSYLDIGCASGRVLRHMGLERPASRAMGCDINRLHVEWCNANLPANCSVFQNHSIPSLPLPDHSVDLASAYSVFTHIEALETAWLMEIRRILRPGGLAWITVHTERTLEDMSPSWPLWTPTMEHPEAQTLLDEQRRFQGDRLVLRWHANKSYSSNVFYKLDYLKSRWGRILEVVEVRQRFPGYQDVLILRNSHH
jgi:SAM-dependent methyltransferase